MRQIVSVLFAAALAISSGCVRSGKHFQSSATKHSFTPVLQQIDPRMLVFRQRADGKSAVFESDKVTLIFPDLKPSERNSFDGEELAIQIAGEGRSETTRSCNRSGRITTFSASYEAGVSTITFCGRAVKLADEARKVIIGDKEIELLPGSDKKVMVASHD